MKHYEARLSSKGQITIPGEVRQVLDLKEGDRVDFYVDGHTVRLVPRNKTFADLLGILANDAVGKAGPLMPEAIDDAVGQYLVEKHKRIDREWNEWREFEEWRKARAVKAAG